MRSPAWYAYNVLRVAFSTRSQSDEAQIIVKLSAGGPPTFVEFGFHPKEYNCSSLRNFSGLLIDGDKDLVRLGKITLPKRIKCINAFLTRDDTSLISGHFESIGVLSIDIDGNDYWMAETLLPLRPWLLSVEYNSSFGLRPITVPYDPLFERHAKHATGWYHGASLEALKRLACRHDYKLAGVSSGGMNAFFVPNSRGDVPELDATSAYRENTLRRKWSGKTTDEQWNVIKEMPYIEV